VRPANNYDNFYYALVTFFEISTLEMWPDIMYAAVDSSNEVDHGPVKDNKLLWMPIMYISFIMVTTFFAMNLFLSVVINKF
jgi:hypothetical protein